MADFPTQARVVIIGGGAVGVSALYHLAKAGWTDCVLLEKNELTAGSTWHAAGNCPSFSTSWAVMNMQRYSLSLYRGLAKEVDYPMNYHVSGSIRLGHSKERMQEFERARGMGLSQGMSLEMMQVEDIKGRYPFIETHDLAGALYDPDDGDIDPAQLTQALAKGARQMGAQILRFTPATGVSKAGEDWIVHTEKGDIRCEKVVNAAGYYAQRVGEWFKPYGGRTVPMAVMSHQFFLTEPIAELEAWTAENGKLPLLRDVDSSYYLRQEKTGFNLGPYERNCKAHWVDPSDPMPEDFSFQLYPDDLERLEWYIEDAMARVPLLGTSGVSRVINGPIPYAPDGLPLLGPMPGVRNAYEACVFTFGITQAGGAGKVLAEWVTEGQTEWDMWSCDPRRFTDYTDPEYCVAKAIEVYGHEYAMHFPWHRWPAAPNRRKSSLHDRLEAAGAQFGAYNGWERANWFAKPGDDTSETTTQTWERAGPWEPRIRAEAEAVREHCGVLAISGFSRFEVEGPGARAFVDSLTSGRLPKEGRVGLGYFPDARGRIVTEMSVIVKGDDHVGLITAGTAQWHDSEHLWRQAPEGITVTDHSDEMECLLVTGPKARDILGPLADADLSLPWLSVQTGCTLADRPCTLLRVSFAGELGWEVHCPIGDAPAIWDAVTQAGATPFGMFALNSLRVEKGYRAWKGDLSTDYTLLEGGLDRFVDWSKPFVGKAALEAEKQQGVKKRFTLLTLDTPGAADAPYMSTVWQDGALVGETTSGAWGYRTGQSVALAMLRPDLCAKGTKVEVEIFGERFLATVQGDAPLWDPQNDRLRA
ncbi:MAG: FAD-dependent oxidoreductase [Flavimaricola sp.]|nr:FAD-dependent oxidoreductase [Flavimaricola sp.]